METAETYLDIIEWAVEAPPIDCLKAADFLLNL